MVFAKGVTEADMPPLAVVVCAYSTAGVVFAVSHSWRKYWNNGRSMSLACCSRVAKVRRTIATGRKARAVSCVTWTRSQVAFHMQKSTPTFGRCHISTGRNGSGTHGVGLVGKIVGSLGLVHFRCQTELFWDWERGIGVLLRVAECWDPRNKDQHKSVM